uniref:Uncharacterized protein n=1 Tax=Pararge aegeria TaxID=116150 RepID=S4NZ97_9NEOP
MEDPRWHPYCCCYHSHHVFCLLLLSFWYMLSELCSFLPVYAFHFCALNEHTRHSLVRIFSPFRTKNLRLADTHHSLNCIDIQYFRQSPHPIRDTCGKLA